ncbi:DUF4434 domain-containing protein [Petrimonas sp.]|uniref:DUF4434 domain-containing protein n=1 Tax=Petrimonas sp. TaxID=2023866 RepID=UPI003F51430E
MKKSIIFCTLILFVFGCEKDLPENPVEPDDKNIIVDAKKALTGTFIDFWYKADWEQSQWDSHFREMKQIGLNTVIIQFTSYGDNTWFKSANTFTKTKYPNALSRLLSAAVKTKTDVYIGLYFSDEYWQNQTNADWLKLHADRCIYIANEINQQFGSNSAFKGWYIPHEPEPFAYNSAELVASFKDNFVNKISDKLHSFNSKPVSIAAFWNSELTSPAQLQHFMAELSKCNLQVIMLQDGVGVKHVTLENLKQYYTSADNGLYIENKNYKGEFWTDLETFQTPQAPAGIERIKTQLSVELATPHISKAVSFQYYNDMCPTGKFGNSASKLRTDYLNFIKTLK